MKIIYYTKKLWRRKIMRKSWQILNEDKFAKKNRTNVNFWIISKQSLFYNNFLDIYSIEYEVYIWKNVFHPQITSTVKFDENT